ncbi:MAG: sigma-70 family RNA polymerase sigma factor [Nanoarchaeota archaeon]|nr:sigma-70 family RNA polymerase sigma factor [Nanoarchaeota archaeon]
MHYKSNESSQLEPDYSVLKGDSPDLVAIYKRDLEGMSGEPLPYEKQAELARRIRRGDEESKEELVNSHLRFVISVAKNYRNQGADFLDLIQAGNMGLLIVAEKFDETRGYQFGSYAIWWVEEEIRRTIKCNQRSVRVPENVFSDFGKIKGIVSELEEKKIEPLNHVGYIAKKAGISVSRIKNALVITKREISLDRNLEEEEGRNLYKVLSNCEELQDEEVVENELKKTMKEILSGLKPREAKVLILYFGLDPRYYCEDFDVQSLQTRRHNPEGGLPLELIGGYLGGVSKEGVRQLKERALTKLRHPTKRRRLEGFF